MPGTPEARAVERAYVLQHASHLTPGPQRVYGRWSDRTFPAATPDSLAQTARREADELAEAVEAGDVAAVAEEAADVVLALYHLAHRLGFDLLRAAEAKAGINTRRTWQAAEAGGFEHVRGDHPDPVALHAL